LDKIMPNNAITGEADPAMQDLDGRAERGMLGEPAGAVLYRRKMQGACG
jgi:hypothetical protein